MTFRLRPCEKADYPSLVDVANAAVPWDETMNRRWAANRRHFPEPQRSRRHYVVTDKTDALVGYGAIEHQDKHTYRMFVVTAHNNLPTVGEILYEKLSDDLKQLNVAHVFMMEYKQDRPFLNFLTARGYSKTREFSEWQLSLESLKDVSISILHNIEIVTLSDEQANNPNYEVHTMVLLKQITGKKYPVNAISDIVSGTSFMTMANDGERYLAVFSTTDDRLPYMLQQHWSYMLPDVPIEIAIALRLKLAELALKQKYTTLLAYTNNDDTQEITINKNSGFEMTHEFVVLDKSL